MTPETPALVLVNLGCAARSGPKGFVAALFRSQDGAIAAIALFGLGLHLIVRFGPWREANVFGLPWFEIPLLIALVAGGIPLVAGLGRHALRLEFNSDLLAGMS